MTGFKKEGKFGKSESGAEKRGIERGIAKFKEKGGFVFFSQYGGKTA